MLHVMKLQPQYYEYILNGTKRIELRLNDEKRKLIRIGDTIKFLKEPDLTESFNTKVIDIFKYKSFEELFENFEVEILADKEMSKKDILKELEKFYTKEQQVKYGVLAIKIEI